MTAIVKETDNNIRVVTRKGFESIDDMNEYADRVRQDDQYLVRSYKKRHFNNNTIYYIEVGVIV